MASQPSPDSITCAASETRAGFGFARTRFESGNIEPFKAEVEQGRVRVVLDWRQGFQGRGCERYASGEVYVGQFMAGERTGYGTFRHTNGQILVSAWRQNAPIGEGVQWQKDGSKAALLKDGKPVKGISIEEGAVIAERLNLPVPSEWFQAKS